MCGETKALTIQSNGITWGHIVYEDPALASLITNPGHRNAREGGEGTRYDCFRDPNDLGRIYVVDPYDKEGRVLTVPATQAHRRYAEGLHRHVHRLAVAHAKAEVRGELDFDALMRALDRLGQLAVTLRAQPKRKRTERGLARFLHGLRKERRRSDVRPGKAPDASTAAHLDPLAIARRGAVSADTAKPAEAAPADAVPTPAQAGTGQGIPTGPDPVGPEAASPSLTTEADRTAAGTRREDEDTSDDDDLAALRARKGWGTAYE